MVRRLDFFSVLGLTVTLYFLTIKQGLPKASHLDLTLVSVLSGLSYEQCTYQSMENDQATAYGKTI